MTNFFVKNNDNKKRNLNVLESMDRHKNDAYKGNNEQMILICNGTLNNWL